eukprot:3152625-Pleurochrysis_carterae.AAC.1
MSIGRHKVGGGRRLPRRWDLRLGTGPGVVAAEPNDSPRGAVSEPVREQSSGLAAPERGASRATDSAMSANGDERAADDGQAVVPKIRWRKIGSRKRGSAARCSERLAVEEEVDVRASAAAGGTGGATGDVAGAPVNWRSR